MGIIRFDHFGFIAPLYARASADPASVARLDSLARLPVSGRLLDLGGGTGRIASALRGQAAQIVVADESIGMLRQVPDGLDAVRGLSECLPFAASSFDAILLVDALHHVASQAGTVREMWRVLAPGGRIVIEEPDIRAMVVKGIAVGEKLLGMRSHFLPPDDIAGLFPGDARVEIVTGRSSVWVMAAKM
jgi:demethylmenaquinone methyltransferase/2-methoxy-6-polyprenyl-1,4-benzoquinol methylase